MHDYYAQLLHKIFLIETLSSLGISILFGFSLLFMALPLLSREIRPVLFSLNRGLLLLGIFLLVISMLMQFLVPTATTMTNLVYLGIALVLSCLAHFVAKEVSFFSFFTAALIFLSNTLSLFLFARSPAPPLLASPIPSSLVFAHVISAALGEGLCVIAFFSSLLYLKDYSKLKKGTLEKKPRIPSLNRLESLTEKTLLFGMALMTFTLISGLLLVISDRSYLSSNTLKVFWAFLVWGWFVLAILGRALWGWRSRKGALMAIGGALFLLIGLFGAAWHNYA